MNTENIALRAAEAMRDAAAGLADGDLHDLRVQGSREAYDAREYVARRIRAIDAYKLVDQITDAQPNPDELAAFAAAAKSANFNVQRRDNGELFHPIAQRVHQVWRAAVRWAREQGAPPVPAAEQPGVLMRKVEQALTLAMAICDAVPSRAHQLPDGEPMKHLGKLVNHQEDTGQHGYAVIRNALVEVTAHLARQSAAEQPAASIDTPKFRMMLSDWATTNCEDEAATKRLIAHIDAHLARQAQAGAVATVIKKGAERQWMSEALGSLPDGMYSLYLAAPTLGSAAQAEVIVNVIEQLMGDDLIQWVCDGPAYEGDHTAFNSDEQERAVLRQHVLATVAKLAAPVAQEGEQSAIPQGAARASNGTTYHNIAEIYHRFEEGEALHAVLDEKKVPRADAADMVYSLVGRVERLVESLAAPSSTDASAQKNPVAVIEGVSVDDGNVDFVLKWLRPGACEIGTRLFASAQAAQADVRDAARYRWLRDAAAEVQGVRVVIDERLRFLEKLDTAIDAAMARTPADDSQNAVGGAA